MYGSGSGDAYERVGLGGALSGCMGRCWHGRLEMRGGDGDGSLLWVFYAWFKVVGAVGWGRGR